MGASDDGDGGGIPLDCRVGTIVWVRRRNGSWWPGRILGQEELSASHLMSPRSGTPVKLLGREDASVDWYNLEKSKRVKPFRCGEFDACIERAEASQGAPIKKREKYARREDAILHALELEKKQLEMKQQKSGIVSNGVTTKPLGLKKGKNFLSSDIITKNDYSASYSKYGINKIRKSNPLHDEENRNNPVFVDDAKTGKVKGWEEGTTETMPRMRGLQDFGLRIAPKKKPLPSAVWETPKNSAENKSNAFPPIGTATHNKFMKGKRSSGTTEDSLGKKRDKRRPLVQVLQSTAKLASSHATQFDDSPHSIPIQGEKNDAVIVCRAKRSRCIYLPADSNDSVQHGGYNFEEEPMATTQFEMNNCFDDPGSLTRDHASSVISEPDLPDSSETEYLESDMEEGEEMDHLIDAGQTISSGPGDCKPATIQVSDKINIEGFEMAISSDMNEMHSHEYSEDASPEVGVSKWHLKGKRNNRNLLRRPADMTDGKISGMSSEKCNGLPQDTAYGMKGNSFIRGEMELSSQWTVGSGSDHGKRSAHYVSGMSDMISEDSSQDEMIGYSKQRYPSLLNLARDRGRSHKKYRDLEDEGRYSDSRAYWNDGDDPMYTAYISKGRGPTLIDVDVKVERSYHGERVPLVSLMSRLNGKAIIGHPVQVEILEHGSTDQFFSSNYPGLDDSSTTQPVWRTARRTAMQRIPRSNPIASSMEGEEVGTSQFPERESKPLIKNSGHQARLMKQSYLHIRKRPSGKYRKKSSKKASLSNQKTRTLSSFAIERKLASASRDSKLARSSDILGGLIKPEGSMPLVTCVPVKVAFSRILEAVGRPSSNTAHRVRMTSPVIRDPC